MAEGLYDDDDLGSLVIFVCGGWKCDDLAR